MRKKTDRISTSGGGQLTSNPFEQLTSLLPDAPALPQLSPEEHPAQPVAPAFTIARTQKGGWPVAAERRAAGKTVTVVSRVSGNTHLLCNLLKKHCAAGGKALDDAVEIQGHHSDAIKTFLETNGY